MGKRTKYSVDFYLENLQLGNFDKHCEWLHNNELPATDVYCPDCKTQVYSNCTMNTWICYTCFRTFTKEEIIGLDPNSKECELCKKKIMWWVDVCGVCKNKQYKIGDFMKGKLSFITNKMYRINESIFHYKWSFYEFKYKETQIKNINNLVRSLERFKKIIENIDVYSDKIKPTIKKGSKRWKIRQQNTIKFGIKVLKKEKRLIEEKNKRVSLERCPRCYTKLIIKHTELFKDYCPKCHDGLVYVIDTETGRGKTCFFNDLIGK